MPKYAALIYEAGNGEPPAADQMEKVMAEYGAFGQEAGAAGVIVGGEALEGVHTATTIHVEGGKGGDLVTTDGPFAETKEVLTGFYLLEAADLDEAIGWARKIPGAWYGRVEVRPCMVFED